MTVTPLLVEKKEINNCGNENQDYGG